MDLFAGARGFDLGFAVLVVARDKLVISVKGMPEHFTVHLGPKSGVVDIHRTMQSADSPQPRYTTLYKIRHQDFESMMQALTPAVKAILKDVVRPLRLRWMRQRKATAIVGVPPSESVARRLMAKHQGKIGLDRCLVADYWRSSVWLPNELEDLYRLGDGVLFTVIARRGRVFRKLGVGFVVRDRAGQPWLKWVSDQKVQLAFAEITRLLDAAVARYECERPELPN